MAITFTQKTKRQQYLIIIFIGLIFVLFIFLGKGYFVEIQPLPEVSIQLPPKVKINFELLGSPALVNLQPFEEITPLLFEGEEVSLNPTLSWQSIPEAGIYLWEVVGVESGRTKETSVTVSKKLEPSTTYTWRVRACKEDTSECGFWSGNCQNGNELSCWRFSTIKQPPIILVFPPPEAENIYRNPTLSWQSIPEAGIYLWEVVGVESGRTKETSVTVSKKLEPSTTYTWRVRACKEDTSECGFWSGQTFTTLPAFFSPRLVSPLMKEIFIKGREDPFTPYETTGPSD